MPKSTLPMSIDLTELTKALATATSALELLELQQAEGKLKKTHERRIIKRQRARLLTQLRAVVRNTIATRKVAQAVVPTTITKEQ